MVAGVILDFFAVIEFRIIRCKFLFSMANKLMMVVVVLELSTKCG